MAPFGRVWVKRPRERRGRLIQDGDFGVFCGSNDRASGAVVGARMAPFGRLRIKRRRERRGRLIQNGAFWAFADQTTARAERSFDPGWCRLGVCGSKVPLGRLRIKRPRARRGRLIQDDAVVVFADQTTAPEIGAA